MGKGNNGQHSTANKTDFDTRINRYKFWTAIAVLVAALIPTTTTLITMQEILRGIAMLVEKPLEGEWHYESKYERYYDEQEPQMLEGKGKAIIIWKHLEKRYEVNLSYGIKRSASATQLLSSFLYGYIDANEDGWPAQQNFTIDQLTVLNSVQYMGIPPSMQTYQFKDCTYFKKGDRAQSITCIFETPKTKSRIKLNLISTLH